MKSPLPILASLLCSVAVTKARQPNIVFILADDLGYGEVGCFGQKLMATPNLDRMAAEGMKFSSFYAGAPVCGPSRSVLMTGLHTGHTRIRGNALQSNSKAQILRAGDLTVSEVLQKAGYKTALVGKWGLGCEGSEGHPNRKGFDYFYGYLDHSHAHNPYPPFIVRNSERVPLRNGLVSGSDKGYTSGTGAGIAASPVDFVPDLMTDEVLKWVASCKDRPFFLFWSLVTPHANNEGTKFGRGQEVPDLGDYKNRPWPQPDKAHAAIVSRMDADIGRLLDLLKKTGIDENTLIIFTSDNGHHREGGNNPKLFAAAGPLTGMKRDLTDGGVRVPTIARWPGTIPPGSEVRKAQGFADILPTFADLAGATLPRPDQFDGTSFANLLRNVPGESPSRKPFYWEFHEMGFSQAVIIDERWKAIRLKRRDAPIRLFDLQNDVAERNDLAAEHPDLVAKAKSLFESERTDLTEWPIREK